MYKMNIEAAAEWQNGGGYAFVPAAQVVVESKFSTPPHHLSTQDADVDHDTI